MLLEKEFRQEQKFAVYKEWVPFQRGGIFKGLGVSGLVTEGESEIFSCDGEDRAEADGHGTSTGPG